MMECETDIGKLEIDNKTEIKQEPYLFERTLTELKSELEVAQESDIHIKREPFFFASEWIVKSESNLSADDHEIDTKVDIKEELVVSESASAELKSESKEIELKDEEIHREDNALAEDEFVLSDSTRLNTEAVWHCESDIPNASLAKDCLKLRGKNILCHTNTARGNDITRTLHIDDHMSHKCNICDWIQKQQATMNLLSPAQV